MMFKTKGLGKNLGGVILEKETLYQKDASGKELKIFKWCLSQNKLFEERSDSPE